ncbi:MFS transporter [Arthrobacter sp. NyZ413]|uniref:MFS transporter n=1 Tax=Arthrobacter sp. NyZ413 TaxID=3144669 RepID=UPI003BF87378
MTVTRELVRRRLLAAGSSLRVRNYRLYTVGQSVSVAGNFMQTLAIAFLTLHLTGSGSALGLAVGIRLLPYLVAGPISGVIADRHDKRRMLLFTQTACALCSAVFGVLALTGWMTYPLLLGLSFLLGCLTVFDNPARQSIISELVEDADLSNAIILSSVLINLARVLGSAVGGALVAIIGIPACFFCNAASFGSVIVSLVMMRPSEMFRSERAPRAPGQVREGVRYALTTRDLAITLLMIIVTGTLAWEFPTTLPLLATDAFAGNAATYSALVTAMSVGSIVGGLVAAGRRAASTPFTLSLTAAAWGSTMILAALAPTIVPALVALALVGFASIAFNSGAKANLQLTARADMRGRVMALWAMCWGGSTVIGAPLMGWIAQEFGSRWGLLAGGIPTLILGLALLPLLRREDRNLRGHHPGPDDEPDDPRADPYPDPTVGPPAG